MTLGLYLYKILTTLIAPFLGAFFRRRASAEKENPDRIHERFVRSVPDRPEGSLLWLHAASVGESQLLLEFARRLVTRGTPYPSILFTCQTQTAARLIESSYRADPDLMSLILIQQMAPVDTGSIARRFLNHWRPDLAVFAEGEIWPNLLLGLKTRQVPVALINARMTEKSILGWMRWRRTARRIFQCFDVMLAADLQTKTGLEALSARPVQSPGNLKSALPAPSVDENTLGSMKDLIGDCYVLVAASTHAGEEALVLDALMQLDPRPFLILAPRHPERGDQIASLLSMSKFRVARRSIGEPVTPETDVLLADTMGEMGLWFRLADAVYLGGGHAPGVGGHNPIEALLLGKPVLSGPSVFNFQDLCVRLSAHQGFSFVDDATALANALPAPEVAETLTDMLQSDALGPMSATLEALQPFLDRMKEPG